MSQQARQRKRTSSETATHLFKENGFHNTSMQDLADALGMQKGRLYYYIDSKEELLRCLLERATSVHGLPIDEIYACDLPWPKTTLGPGKPRRDHDGAPGPGLCLLQEYRNLPPAG